MSCKEICVKYKTRKGYSKGQKRCQICEIFIKWDGVYCPCCSHRLRSHPRNKTKCWSMKQ